MAAVEQVASVVYEARKIWPRIFCARIRPKISGGRIALPHDDNPLANKQDDPTPTVGAATDVAPLGRGAARPPHELTADEDADVVDWERVAASAEFKALVAAKRRFIIPATIFFIVYYFALLVLIWLAPALMSRRVFGVVNLAYLFALSQFFMTWMLAALYVRAANRHDRMARDIAENSTARKGGR
jgi:uncharacterized membrane protein (DUF485 family)